ncbi:MAG: undecaprenyl/decaprenyl-phosphate alpha-N-acetylglucosaminyl 1-phosphate transferase [Acidimicrobiia bacterium]|nr:undecaprenyl/decaprenyl-phosphate alpha-N-acetylglucosaminyl 1-phosphate transferase [Acidimicrobiia bacterium]
MHGGNLQIGLLGVSSFASVALLMPLVRSVALRYGVIDRPAAGKLHTTVTPYLGGVAILITGLGASTFLPSWSAQGVGIVVGAVVVGLVGLVDDMRTLNPGPRLVMEAAAASLAFFTGARIHLVNGPVDWVLTVTWLVVLTNSFNLLDNMDGAAAVIGSATAVALAVAAVLGGQVLVGGMAAVVAGSCLGFLLYNWYPARIFMGDAGSLFVGFLLAGLALKLRFPVGHVAGVAAVALLAGLALFDTTLVVISRAWHRRPIYMGGTDHTSHRLMRLGMSTPAVGVVLMVVTGMCGAIGVAVGRGALSPWVVLPVGAVGLSALVAFLSYEAAQDRPALTLPGVEPAVLAEAVE